MKTIAAQFDKQTYPVYIGEGIADNLKNIIEGICDTEKVIFFTNNKIDSIYGQPNVSQFKTKTNIHKIILPDGERYKNIDTLNRLYDSLLRVKTDRNIVIIALGGGVIGDIAGMAAATYMRGIRYIQIPTTLLSMVDSSIGGKVGVDHPRCKNLVGTFYTPEFVLIDPQFLNTLPTREIICGMAEVIKYGLILSSRFFKWLKSNSTALMQLKPKAVNHAILQSCLLKNRVVASDPFDRDERKILNFGHTFGHALESAGQYKTLKHGEAVMIGMLMAVELSALTHNLDSKKAVELKEFLLPYLSAVIRHKPIEKYLKQLDVKTIHKNMVLDKKNQNNTNEFILLDQIGRAITQRGIDDILIDRSMASALNIIFQANTR